MSKTKIDWCDYSWNPITGCTKCSPGCQNCYAAPMARRNAGRNGYPSGDGFAVTFHPKRLQEPMRWRKPAKIFVCSMGDLFHPDVKDEWLDKIFAVMAMCPQHTFMVLTKRPERMREYMAGNCTERWLDEAVDLVYNCEYVDWKTFPLPNVWLGVTAENQEQTDKRIPVLLDTPAAKRFVSVEPMLGPVDVRRYLYDRSTVLDWVICGGETGPKARPMHPDWVRSLRDQCQIAETPFFFKQWGEWAPDCLCEKAGACRSIARPEPGIIGDMFCCGKRAAGHLLDGKEWRQVP